MLKRIKNIQLGYLIFRHFSELFFIIIYDFFFFCYIRGIECSHPVYRIFAKLVFLACAEPAD